jgi:F1F0 ATPase subunit 2
MTNYADYATIWVPAIGLVAGFVVGAVHFAALRWNTRLFGSGRPGLALCMQAARCLLTAVLLFALARAGFAALLAGMAGLLVARQAALRVAAAQ